MTESLFGPQPKRKPGPRRPKGVKRAPKTRYLTAKQTRRRSDDFLAKAAQQNSPVRRSRKKSIVLNNPGRVKIQQLPNGQIGVTVIRKKGRKR